MTPLALYIAIFIWITIPLTIVIGIALMVKNDKETIMTNDIVLDDFEKRISE